MLQRISEDEEFSEEWRTLLYIQHWPSLHKFFVPSTNWRPWWWIFFILSPVPSLSLNVRFYFNKLGYTLCLLYRSNHLIRINTFIKHTKIISETQNFIWNKNFKQFKNMTFGGSIWGSPGGSTPKLYQNISLLNMFWYQNCNGSLGLPIQRNWFLVGQFGWLPAKWYP